ncbi:MAG: 50S ribosomal protein L11 methyltransferase [Bacteroidales bacterium]|nr:50S ribosomal protein L11 methyltransferase [Bacteroidales bacterium]
MNTVELLFIIHADRSERRNIADILVAQLSELGYQSFMDTPEGLKAYIPQEAFDVQALDDLPIHPVYPGKIQWQHQVIHDKNWNAEWEKNFQPVVVDDQCLIRAPFHPRRDPYPYEVVIEPKMSFGTGHHPTTYLMIQWLLEQDPTGSRVLDIGAGTGILAILAAKKGAAEIWAVDNNEWAYLNARENAQINHAQNIRVIQGTVNSIRREHFDLILANINLSILQQDLPDYADMLNKNGILIMSGIYEQDMEKLTGLAEKHHLRLLGHKENNRWVALAFRKDQS